MTAGSQLKAPVRRRGSLDAWLPARFVQVFPVAWEREASWNEHRSTGPRWHASSPVSLKAVHHPGDSVETKALQVPRPVTCTLLLLLLLLSLWTHVGSWHAWIPVWRPLTSASIHFLTQTLGKAATRRPMDGCRTDRHPDRNAVRRTALSRRRHSLYIEWNKRSDDAPGGAPITANWRSAGGDAAFSVEPWRNSGCFHRCADGSQRYLPLRSRDSLQPLLDCFRGHLKAG